MYIHTYKHMYTHTPCAYTQILLHAYTRPLLHAFVSVTINALKFGY